MVNTFPIKLNEPDPNDKTKYQEITTQPDKTFRSNLFSIISKCSIVKNEIETEQFIKITPTQGNSDDNYVMFDNIRYKLQSAILFYSPLHIVRSVNNQISELMLKLENVQSNEIPLYICIPISGGYVTSSRFFIEVLNKINQGDDDDDDVQLSNSFNFDSLIPLNSSYYYYKSTDKKTQKVRDSNGKEETLTDESKDAHIFVMKKEISISNMEANKLSSFRKYDYVQNEADEANIWYYYGNDNASNSSSLLSNMGEGWYMSCQDSDDIEGGTSSDLEKEEKKKPLNKYKLLALCSIVIGLVVVPICHIIGHSIGLDSKGVLGLDGLPISIMFVLFAFYMDTDEGIQLKIANFIVAGIICAISFFLIFSSFFSSSQ
jgi:hypothetical protein